MTKRTKALSGASQDAYFRRVFKAYAGLSPEEREKLVHRLRREIAQLRLRRGERVEDAAATSSRELPSASSVPTAQNPAADTPTAKIVVPAVPPFDPFALNIVLLVRKTGRDGALGALADIDNVDNLRLLAREQRLSIGAHLASADEMRAAIVQAAERRIANRIAAAS
jgi:hypothetical protein